MMNFIGYILFSFFIIWWGFSIIETGEVGGWGIYKKIGEDISKTKHISGGIIIFFGCLFLWMLIKGKIDEKRNEGDYKEDSKEYLVCPKCKNVYEKEKIDFTECPNCKVKLLTTLEFLEKSKKERKWWQE